MAIFYIAYEYQNVTSVTQSTEQCAFPNVYNSDTQTTNSTVHFMLLRVGTDGSSSKIDVKDWKPTSVSQTSNFPGAVGNSYVNTGAVPSLQQINIITNADQGTVLGWETDMPAYCTSGTLSTSACNQQVAAASTFGFATTVGDSLAASSSKTTAAFPVLQAQDGTFYGTDNTYNNMVAFDKSGNVLWSVPNDYPQIATADGGVIGYSGVTYDNNGRATGQIGNIPTQSWTGNAYTDGPVQKVVFTPTNDATGPWHVDGANASANSTAAFEETLYFRSFAPWYQFGHDPFAYTDVTGTICTKWNERESTWRKSGSCQSRGTSQSKS